MGRIIYVSFYTKGDFELIAKNYLLPSMEKLDLEIDVEVLEPFDSWLKAVRHKIAFMSEKAEQYPNNPIVWLDVDLRVKKDPTPYFQHLSEECDLAIHRKNTDRTLLGAVYMLGATPGRKIILDMWAYYREKMRGFVDDIILTKTIDQLHKLKIAQLPTEYSYVEHQHEKIDDPFIQVYCHEWVLKELKKCGS